MDARWYGFNGGWGIIFTLDEIRLMPELDWNEIGSKKANLWSVLVWKVESGEVRLIDPCWVNVNVWTCWFWYMETDTIIHILYNSALCMLTDRADLLCAGEPWGQGCWGQGSRKWAGGHQPWHQGADCPGVYVIICTTWFAIPFCVHYYWHHTVCFSYHPDVCIIFTTWFAYLTTRMCTSLFVPHGLPLLPPRCVHHYLFNTVCPYFHPDVYIIFLYSLFALLTTLMSASLLTLHCLPFLPNCCVHHYLCHTVCPFWHRDVHSITYSILTFCPLVCASFISNSWMGLLQWQPDFRIQIFFRKQ